MKVQLAVCGILLSAVASCCWLAAGAGAGAGYKAGTDERSIGTQVDDAAITAKIKTKLVTAKGIRSLNIDVDCLDGHVTLTGIVKNSTQVKRVLEIAHSVHGVKAVTNNLKVDE